jgi:hypothetical protein
MAQAAGRIWPRQQRRIAAAKGISAKAAAAQALIAGADGPELAVLREELPSLLEDEGVPTDWLDTAFAKIPAAAGALANRDMLAKGYAVVRYNHEKLKKAINSGLAAPVLVDPGSISDRPYVNPTGG